MVESIPRSNTGYAGTAPVYSRLAPVQDRPAPAQARPAPAQDRPAPAQDRLFPVQDQTCTVVLWEQSPSSSPNGEDFRSFQALKASMHSNL